VSKLLTDLNELLTRNTLEDHFVTLFFVCIDPRDESFIYASAGHQACLLEADGTTKVLEATSPPLGVIGDVVVPASEPMTLQPGQTLLLLTDGISEAMNPEGDLFGIERVLDLTRANLDLPSREIAEVVYSAARAFSNGAQQQDDMTAVILKVGYDTRISGNLCRHGTMARK
jgi:sigma-B regulation protein RsbU (phosphoserine phosphatase)